MLENIKKEIPLGNGYSVIHAGTLFLRAPSGILYQLKDDKYRALNRSINRIWFDSSGRGLGISYVWRECGSGYMGTPDYSTEYVPVKECISDRGWFERDFYVSPKEHENIQWSETLGPTELRDLVSMLEKPSNYDQYSSSDLKIWHIPHMPYDQFNTTPIITIQKNFIEFARSKNVGPEAFDKIVDEIHKPCHIYFKESEYVSHNFWKKIVTVMAYHINNTPEDLEKQLKNLIKLNKSNKPRIKFIANLPKTPSPVLDVILKTMEGFDNDLVSAIENNPNANEYNRAMIKDLRAESEERRRVAEDVRLKRERAETESIRLAKIAAEQERLRIEPIKEANRQTLDEIKKNLGLR